MRASLYLTALQRRGAWALLIDTVAAELASARTLQVGEHYQLCARSLLLFELLPEAT